MSATMAQPPTDTGTGPLIPRTDVLSEPAVATDTAPGLQPTHPGTGPIAGSESLDASATDAEQPAATASMAFIKRHAVFIYFVLAFAISWIGFVVAVGPGGFLGAGSQFNPALPMVVAAMLAGPTISGLTMTGLVEGWLGYRRLLARLTTWHIGVGWYAFALLTAPALAWILCSAFSLTPPIFATDDKSAFFMSSVVAGLIGGFFEEVGWTGFATPRLRLRYSVFATGLIVGIPWGAWHLLQGLWVAGTFAGAVPLLLFIPLNFVSGIAELTPYRILMVWLYDRTQSLLVTVLMHASLITGTIFLFTPGATGAEGLASAYALAAAFWLVVAAVALGNRGHMTRTEVASADIRRSL